jgi:mono/diheme cytochrome c family protein
LGTVIATWAAYKEDALVKEIFNVALVVALLVIPAVASAQGQAQAGQQVFAAQKCSICHSIAGQGNKKGPLDGVGAKLSADEIRQWIVNPLEMAAKAKAERKPPMKPFTLPKDELDGLVAYLQSLKK